MSPVAFPGFVGVIEWPDSEPDVILAATAHGVRVAALNFFLTRRRDGTFDLATRAGCHDQILARSHAANSTVKTTLGAIAPSQVAAVPQECAGYTAPATHPNNPLAETGPHVV